MRNPLGEVCDIAMETVLSGQFRLRMDKGTVPLAPEIHRPDLIVTMVFDPGVNAAAVTTMDRMTTVVMAQTGLSRTQAWCHCSICVDLHVPGLSVAAKTSIAPCAPWRR